MPSFFDFAIPHTDIERLRSVATDGTRHIQEVLRAQLLLRIATNRETGAISTVDGLARDVGLSPTSVRTAIRNYQFGGIEAVLDWQGTSARRSVVTEEMLEALQQLRAERSNASGRHFKSTYLSLSEELRNRGFPCSPSTIRQAVLLLTKRSERGR